ncbi:MAG: FKBP-type peptidyl-prolyl cis-trans isomerase [Akkermansiaceae bacterium]
MTLMNRRALSGILIGAMSLSVLAQEPVDPRTGKPATPAKPAVTPPVEVPPASPEKSTAPADVAAPPADALRSESGLASKLIKKGTGTEKPTANDGVVAHYTGWTTDGKQFDSSRDRGLPTPFALDSVIAGWTEGLQLMVVGEQRRFWIPEDLAYKGQPGQPKGMLVFDVELMEIKKGPAAPANLSAPADAGKTESGLAFKVLKKGEGGPKPGENDIIKMVFFVWDSSGKRVMAPSLQGQEPRDVPLSQLPVAGLVEGLKLMTKGEKRRLWVPKELSFQRGPQNEPIIVDVELLEIKPDPTAAPAEIRTAPADAKKTESGISYVVLKASDAKESPSAKDLATLVFKGWEANGKFIVDTAQQGRPAEIPVNGAPIKAFTEILPQMKKGEKRRLWIPAAQGFARQAGEQDLIFELELVDFKADPNAPAEGILVAPAEAKKSETGVSSIVLTASESTEMPGENDTVSIAFKGWSSKGQFLGGSDQQGRPLEFPIKQAPIKAWSEILPQMKKGEKRRLWIPADQGFPQGGGPGDDLVFEVELLEIQKGEPAPEVPVDVAAPPADAVKTASGLASKVLVKGTGKEKPGPTSRVTVHYTGWTTDGKMFDSSVTRGKPSTFGLNQVIAGWTEGLQLMVVGEKRRFWIPVDLAYQNRPGKPAGMLVFDVELKEIAK